MTERHLNLSKREKLTIEEFVHLAIRSLRLGEFKGIHSVYSGFNEAFKKYFSQDPVQATNKLAEEKKIEIRPIKGGVLLYLPGEAPSQSRGDEALRKMGLEARGEKIS
ncbi:MAG: hypothetical protein ACPLZD_00275 [Candidatus Saccharicenans sp.]|nr:MAG: hypothetical protein C0168_01285 [Candidatus Aminicenantes bacterium]HEK85557.1 hypothetical protein [Candidatus Aminicenantes bacterium]